MKAENANLGGEENGGIFYRPHQAVRDGAMTCCLLLNIMAESGKSLGELVAEQPQYFIEKGKIECSNEKKEPLQKLIYEEVKNENVSTIDGVKIWFKDASAILIRPSGTEPVFRLYAEAKNQDTALKLVQDFTAKLEKLLASI
jgi:phosphomannomutase/phosphoglucomutase